jgi:hypothetical protein
MKSLFNDFIHNVHKDVNCGAFHCAHIDNKILFNFRCYSFIKRDLIMGRSCPLSASHLNCNTTNHQFVFIYIIFSCIIIIVLSFLFRLWYDIICSETHKGVKKRPVSNLNVTCLGSLGLMSSPV